MLTTINIERLLKIVDNFGGVFAINRLPLIQKKQRSLVINLNPSYKEGFHWVAVYFKRDGSAFYFDSFGRLPEGNVLTLIERFAPRGYNYSRMKLQNDFSASCGYFCILFVLLANRQNRFFDLFEKCKTEKNEKKLMRLIKKFID